MNDLFYLSDPLTAIAAHPKSGKTSLAVSLALDALIHHQMGVLFCSASEKTRNSKEPDTRHRMVAAMRELALDRIEEIRVNPKDQDHTAYQESFMATFYLDLFTCDTSEMSLKELRRISHHYIKHHQVKLIVIDDFHLLRGADRKKGVRKLRRLAETWGIRCVIFTGIRSSILLNSEVNILMWLHRVGSHNETQAYLESIILPRRIKKKELSIPLTFCPKSAHFNDVEMIGLYLVTANLEDDKSLLLSVV